MLKRTAETFIRLLYPPLCLHCQTVLKQRGLLFCASCLEQISLAETQERCRTCFGEFHQGRCRRCIYRPVVTHRQIAACEAMGPVKTLLSGIHIGRRECIPAAASLMAYQWLELKLLLPEFLIPLPTSFWQKQKMGFDPHLQLAKELGKIFAVPVISILRKRFDRPYFLAQGGFRHRLEAKEEKGEVLCDRRILLIAPLLDDGLFRSAGNELKVFFPAQIEALAFAAKLD